MSVDGHGAQAVGRPPMPNPVALYETIFHFYGEGERPNFRPIDAVSRRKPYEAVRAVLASRWEVEDFYDIGAGAVAFCYYLHTHPKHARVFLSMVGPFAYVRDAEGELIDPEIDAILTSSGFTMLSHDTLDSILPFWTPDPIMDERGSLWEFLFDYEIEIGLKPDGPQ